MFAEYMENIQMPREFILFILAVALVGRTRRFVVPKIGLIDLIRLIQLTNILKSGIKMQKNFVS